jgi:hypothetical protein
MRAHDEVREGGEDHSFAAFRAFDDVWEFALGGTGRTTYVWEGWPLFRQKVPHVSMAVILSTCRWWLWWGPRSLGGRGAGRIVRCQARASATSFEDSRCEPMT